MTNREINKDYYGFIYITTNLINGKKYIGMHTNFDDDYLGSGKLLLRAIKKYGRENFKREIIAYAKTKEELGKLEKYYIKKYNAIEDENFYNIHEGGYGGYTMAGWNEEEKEKYREKMSKLLSGPNHPRYNVKLSEDTKNKIRQAQLKHWRNLSEEGRKKFSLIMSNAVKGEKNPNYGNKWTEEKKKKLSELRKRNGKTKGPLNGMFGKKGENAINGKKVYMYDENFNLVKVFNTVGLALKFLNLKGHSGLHKAIRNKKLYHGYYWSFKVIDGRCNDYPIWE